MKTIEKIITKLDLSRGAPMGRSNCCPQNYSLVDIGAKHKYLTDGKGRNMIVYDCAVPMSYHADYDKGGAYWGNGKQLRVRYTKDLSYIEFYRN